MDGEATKGIDFTKLAKEAGNILFGKDGRAVIYIDRCGMNESSDKTIPSRRRCASDAERTYESCRVVSWRYRHYAKELGWFPVGSQKEELHK
jgi:hypothetical protein